MLMWNGNKLTVIDVGATDMRVNGESISLAMDIVSGRVDFGSAAIVIDQCAVECAASKLGPARVAVAHQRTDDGATEPRQELSLIAKSKIEEHT